MASFEEVKNTLLAKIYETAVEPGAPSEFDEAFLLSLTNEVGPAIAKAAIGDLFNDNFLYQVSTNPNTYELSAHGIREAEKLSQNSAEQPPTPLFKDFKNALLVELAKTEARETGNANQLHDLRTLAKNAGLSSNEDWVQKAGSSFRDNGLISGNSPLDGGIKAKLTADGLEEAQELMGQMNDVQISPAASIPASDRIVKRSDNENAWANAAEGVIALRNAMTEANDYGDLDDDEFEQKLSEVRALEIMLNAPQVQWSVLNQFATNTVKYLALKFAENAIGNAASALLGYLTALTQGAL